MLFKVHGKKIMSRYSVFIQQNIKISELCKWQRTLLKVCVVHKPVQFAVNNVSRIFQA